MGASRTVLLIRRALSGAGGAERVFRKYQAALSSDSCILPISESTLEASPKKGTLPPAASVSSRTASARPFSIFDSRFPAKRPAFPGRWLPGWWRAIAFARAADRVIASHPEALSITLERGPSAQVFRTGDGVHLRYRALLNRFSLNPWHLVAPALDEKSLRAAQIVIANSKMVASELRAYYPWCAEKIRVIHNGFDPQKFFVPSGPREVLRKTLGLPPTGALFLFAGSGWERKGLAPALEITRLCKHLSPTLVVVGKGNPRSLPRGVIYKGVVDNIADYYRACDALLLPTLYDPFSSVVLEALACGTPVVTTLQNGAAEIVQEGQTGFLLESPRKGLAAASHWLETRPALPPLRIAETVADFTLDREISAIRQIFKELEAAEEVL